MELVETPITVIIFHPLIDKNNLRSTVFDLVVHGLPSTDEFS